MKRSKQVVAVKAASGTGGRQTQSAEATPGELIDMQEAIALLRTTRPTFYRWLRAGKIKGMKVGRQWRFYRADIERFLKGETPRIDVAADMGPLLETLQAKVDEAGGGRLIGEPLHEVQRAVLLMIMLAKAMSASDLHITTHVTAARTKTQGAIRVRIDGVLREVAFFDPRLLPAIMEEWQRMAKCDTTAKRLPQDGRLLVNLAEHFSGAQDTSIDLRVSFVPSVLGLSLTARVLDPSVVLLALDRLEYNPHDREAVTRAIHGASGLVVVTGPTGSGKTTTLFACVNELAGPECKVMSVEDPIEYLIPWTTQIPVNETDGVTFARAVRAILRSAPNVILIGELRDRESLGVALQAALTGHLVLTTLHTDDAAGALKRMVDMGIDPFVVSDATRVIVAQRLIRLVCRACCTPAEPDADRLDWAAQAARRGGLDWHALTRDFKAAGGCPDCNHTGYRGRTVAAEVLEVTPQVGRALRDNASIGELRTTAVGQGMTTMAADGARRAAEGQTTLEEVMRVLGA